MGARKKFGLLKIPFTFVFSACLIKYYLNSCDESTIAAPGSFTGHTMFPSGGDQLQPSRHSSKPCSEKVCGHFTFMVTFCEFV
jgi:hypothetical protein